MQSLSEADAPIRVLVAVACMSLADDIARALRAERYAVHAPTGDRAALRAVRAWRPQVIVLDVDPPGPGPAPLLQELATGGGEAAVLFLAGQRRRPALRHLPVAGNDCLRTPFSLEELTARVRRLARQNGLPGLGSGCFSVADLVLDEDAFEVWRAGRPIHLSATEFRLTRHLMRNAGQAIPSWRLLEHVWRYGFNGDPSVVGTYIGYLRTKIDAAGVPLLHTVRLRGYGMW